MTETNWMRHSVQLGIVGVRRTIRGLRRNPYRLRLLGISAICGVISFGGMGVLYALLLRTLDAPISIPGSVRLGVSALWVGAVWFFSQRTLLYWRRPKAEAFVLTTVSTRTAAVGMLFTEFFTACLFLVPPTVLLVGVVGYAFLSPVSLLLVPLAVGLFAASAIVVGYTLSFAYLFVAARSRGLANQQGQLIVQFVFLVVVGYLVATILADLPAIWEVTTFAWVPMSWLVDLAVLGTPVTASLGRALAGVTGGVLVIGSGSLVVERLARAYWLTDPGSTTHDGGETTPSSRSHDGGTLAAGISPLVIPEFVGRPTQRVAQMVLLRLRRAPRRLLFLVTIVISLGIYLGVIYVQLDEPLALVPVVCALLFPWFAGAAFGLNPLGDEGSVLPATLTSSISGRQFVRGLMVPGLLYGLPITVLCTFVGSIVGPYSLRVQAGFVVIGGLLTVVAVGLAPAVGMQFPRFSAVTIGRSGGVVPPSMTAIIVYSLVVGLLGCGTVFALLAPASIYEYIAGGVVSVGMMRFSSVVSGLGIGLVVARWSYRAAARQFRRYTLA
ncbi:hypothetical protein LPA44_13885 [Halobacterium sp. KA-4]|uniref:hypothetical protein n=1 Tax=Halobacterium sp. KA-4 TaxID=2896367 RepID=UPI001E46720A|nr:hypothetical protein [Halobacterium sp. KA-4]MCD2200976.1 hypothetical protein [Halobacterium sp. KA-4]